MKRALLLVTLAMVWQAPASGAPPVMPQLTQADRTAAFRAAGFTLRGGKWQACGDPGTASYVPGTIEQVADFNGDGQPEAVITEGSGYCFGGTETGYWLVSKRPIGGWTVMSKGQGIALFLKTRGAGNWPDLQIGGPGFCFPVLRWDGRAYVQNRYEYEGKRCRPR